MACHGYIRVAQSAARIDNSACKKCGVGVCEEEDDEDDEEEEGDLIVSIILKDRLEPSSSTMQSPPPGNVLQRRM